MSRQSSCSWLTVGSRAVCVAAQSWPTREQHVNWGAVAQSSRARKIQAITTETGSWKREDGASNNAAIGFPFLHPGLWNRNAAAHATTAMASPVKTTRFLPSRLFDLALRARIQCQHVWMEPLCLGMTESSRHPSNECTRARQQVWGPRLARARGHRSASQRCARKACRLPCQTCHSHRSVWTSCGDVWRIGAAYPLFECEFLHACYMQSIGSALRGLRSAHACTVHAHVVSLFF